MTQKKRPRAKIAAVILAAGQSKRMGRSKQLLPWGNSTILGETIDHVLAAAVDQTIVVTGAFRAEVERIAAARSLRTVHNPLFAAVDLMHSLQQGLRFLLEADPPDGVLVMLGDLPFIQPAVIDAVIAAFRAGQGAIIVPTFGGRRGHPVLFGQRLFEAILDLPPDAMPREILAAHPAEVCELPVASETILRDIDTRQDYDRWRREQD